MFRLTVALSPESAYCTGDSSQCLTIKYLTTLRRAPNFLPFLHGVIPRIRGRSSVISTPLSAAMAKKAVRKSSRIFLAANLRAARALFRWSQEELGLQCGLKRTYVGALERTEVNPGIDNLDKLALGVGILAHVLLLSPDVAYAHIFDAFSQQPK
jgi:hypothetical protein